LSSSVNTIGIYLQFNHYFHTESTQRSFYLQHESGVTKNPTSFQVNKVI
jgi:hypothetical protein